MTLPFIDGPLQCVYFRGTFQTLPHTTVRLRLQRKAVPDHGESIPRAAPDGYSPDTGNNAERDYFGGINIHIQRGFYGKRQLCT